MFSRKSNAKSEELRTEGNKFYSQRNFFNALLKYNESLCYAEPASENVGHAYANRSAVYFEMKLYERCLKNVELAKQHRYPEKNLEVLNNRKAKCNDLVNNSREKPSDVWNFFKLSYPPNVKLPFVVDCLEAKISEKYGRHLITKQALKVGDIVAVEKPFCSILLSESKLYEIPEANIYQRCSDCLKQNALDLIPCGSCCEAMFCSTECSVKSFNRYHKYECSVMNQLLKSGSIHMPLRQFFIALSSFDGEVLKLQEFFKAHEIVSTTVFDYDLRSEDAESDKNRLLALRSCIKSSTVFELEEHEKILENHPQFQNIFRDHLEFIRAFLHRQCQISDLNIHGIFSGSSKKVDEASKMFSHMQQAIGTGSLLFGALTNHSCANNVFRIYVEGKVAYSVCRPIAKGSQIFDCYKASFVRQGKSERQAKLLKEYGFVCDCEACIGNFPTPPDLNFKDFKLFKFANKANEEILQLQPGQAVKKYRECCKLVEKNHRSFPSMELCLLQKCIATFLLKQTQPAVLFP